MNRGTLTQVAGGVASPQGAGPVGSYADVNR